MDTRLMANCDSGCEIGVKIFPKDIDSNLDEFYKSRKQTAQDILAAVYDSETNFIKYIEEIIGGD